MLQAADIECGNINTTLSNSAAITTTINSSSINSSIMSDGMSDDPSSPESAFDESDLLSSTVNDDVTAQLAAAGPIGVAAAAAIATGKKRKRPHSFETNPSIRKRQQTRLLRKLKATIDEYTTRVGQQAVVLCVTPGKPSQSSQSYKVFGSQPLESVVRSCRGVLMQDLDAALAQQAPPPMQENSALHELPPLVIDGIPTPVDKMTQAQLRAFIPLMLKYSTGRGKPGWGKMEYRPVWWPSDLPWANVRSDVRSEDEKQKVSWTHALRTIVKNCYKHHGRDDLLPEFDENPGAQPVQQYSQQTMVQTINNPDGTVSIIQIDTGEGGNQVVTLADGTQAQVVHTVFADQVGQTHLGKLAFENGVQSQQEATQAVQTLAEVAATQQEVIHQPTSMSVDMNNEPTPQSVATLAQATLNNEGQLILTGDAGALGTGMVTIPVSMYSTVVTSIGQYADAQQQHHHHPQQSVQVAMAPTTESHNGDVPDATHAVEVMTVEQSS